MPRKILKGFTLIELLVVVAIIGVLSAIGVVAYNKYTSIAQTRAVKAQNNEIYNFIKTETSIQCINYSDQLSLSFERWGRVNKKTAVCNSNWGSYNGDWDVVNKMFYVFKYYFQMNPEGYSMLFVLQPSLLIKLFLHLNYQYFQHTLRIYLQY